MDLSTKKNTCVNIDDTEPYSLLPSEGPLHNLEKIRYSLYSLCVHEAGLGSMLIAYYYNKQSKEPRETDIGKQAHWLIQNIGHHSKLIEAIRNLRNKLVHNNPIIALNFRCLVRSILGVYNFENHSKGANVILQRMVAEVERLTYIIIDKTSIDDSCEKQDVFNNYCPICRRDTPIQREFETETINGEVKLLTGTDENNLPYGYLLAFKHSEYSADLSGRKMQLLDGTNAGEFVIFCKWNGNAGARMLFSNGNMGNVALTKRVKLYPAVTQKINEAQNDMLTHGKSN